MHALLLAAGMGTRLRPLTDHLPKCLAPIRDRPLLAIWLDALFSDERIERVLVNTHYLPGAVRAFVASSPWRERIDLTHEETLLGTAGTILANRSYFGEAPFFVAHADNLTDADPGRLIDAHLSGRDAFLLTLLAFRTLAPRSCGILEVDNKHRVTGFHEKVADPPGNLANGAVYVFAPEILGRIASLGHPIVDLSTEIVPGLLPRVQAVEHSGFFMDIGTPEAYAYACAAFAPHLGGGRQTLVDP
jgi:mannose-1-phosphate guanylyltransferase